MQACSKRSTVINPAADRDRRVGVSCVAAQDQWYLGRTRPWHEQRRVRNQPSPSATGWPASESQAFGVATNECSVPRSVSLLAAGLRASRHHVAPHSLDGRRNAAPGATSRTTCGTCKSR
jgi:hypothetical protein